MGVESLLLNNVCVISVMSKGVDPAVYKFLASVSPEDQDGSKVGAVEKWKISYFVLARNLIQHWISPNQDDISYSARTFISG